MNRVRTSDRLPTNVSEDGEGLLSEQEKEVLDKLAAAWNAFLVLPELHEWHRREFMDAIHRAQHIVMGRPVARELDRNAAAKEQPRHGIDWFIKAGQNVDNVNLFLGEKTPTGKFVIPIITLERRSVRDELFESVRYFQPLYAAAKGESS